jgi:hypothetical protein
MLYYAMNEGCTGGSFVCWCTDSLITCIYEILWWIRCTYCALQYIYWMFRLQAIMMVGLIWGGKADISTWEVPVWLNVYIKIVREKKWRLRRTRWSEGRTYYIIIVIISLYSISCSGSLNKRLRRWRIAVLGNRDPAWYEVVYGAYIRFLNCHNFNVAVTYISWTPCTTKQLKL